MASINAFLGVGSNIEPRAQYLQRALEALRQVPATQVMAMSPVYETSPVGMAGDTPFYNGVLFLQTRVTMTALASLCWNIEQAHQRPAAEKGQYLDRTLDLDLLLYGDQIFNSNQLVVPHPRLHERLYVLVPLCDVAPLMTHPVFGKTMETLRKDGDFGDQRIELADWQWR